MPLARAVRRFLLVCLAALAFCLPALGDTLRLKDGRVLEGVVVREGEGYVYFKYKIGGIERAELFSTAQIASLERTQPSAPAPEPAPAADTSAPTPPAAPASAGEPAGGAKRIAFLRLGWKPEDTVGPYINKDALEHSAEMLEGKADIVVVWIDTGGGDVGETIELVRYIQNEMKPKFRLVSWVKRAISGGSFTVHPIEETYFMSDASYGGSVAFSMSGGKATAMTGEGLEFMLRFGEEASRYGARDPLIMRAMQVGTDLSVDIDADGVAHWRNDLKGRYIVSEESRILTFNSADATRYKFARGVADTKEELVRLMGVTEWVEVGQDADQHQQDFRDAVYKAAVEIGAILQKMQIAVENGQIPRAERFLADLKSWARRAPAWTKHSANGAPPLTREFFNEVEEQLDELRRQQQAQSGR